jgi:hypothetical protein
VVRRLAGERRLSPSVEARGGEAADAEDPAKAEDAARSVDGPKEASLAVGRNGATIAEVQVESPQDGEEDAQDGAEAMDASLEPGEAGPENGGGVVEVGAGGDRPGGSADPASGRGPRDPQAGRDGGVARVLGEADEAVVVGSLRVLSGHAPRMALGERERKASAGSKRRMGAPRTRT